MIFGLSPSASITLHVILSLIGIATGLVVVCGMLKAARMPAWTAMFLASTVLTSVTGFFLPATQLLPSHVTGIISLAALIPALIALYGFRLAGAWRSVYVAGAVLALYLNAFVGVVQAFLKIPSLNALAPTQSEPPFLIAQGILLLLALGVGTLALRAFHRAPLLRAPA